MKETERKTYNNVYAVHIKDIRTKKPNRAED